MDLISFEINSLQVCVSHGIFYFRPKKHEIHGAASDWNKLRKKLKKRACKVGSDVIRYKSCWRERHSVTKTSLIFENWTTSEYWSCLQDQQMRFLISSDSKWANRSFQYFIGEFDPGSGRTLAACLIHASRADLKRSLLLWWLAADGWVTRRQPALKLGTTTGNGS